MLGAAFETDGVMIVLLYYRLWSPPPSAVARSFPVWPEIGLLPPTIQSRSGMAGDTVAPLTVEHGIASLPDGA